MNTGHSQDSWKSTPTLFISTVPTQLLTPHGKQTNRATFLHVAVACVTHLCGGFFLCKVGPDERLQVQEMGLRIKEEGTWCVPLWGL
jgi:hypothetical protein